MISTPAPRTSSAAGNLILFLIVLVTYFFGLVGDVVAQDIAEAPQWTVGSWWRFEGHEAGNKVDFRRTLSKIDESGNYIILIGTRVRYTHTDLNVADNPLRQWFRWPLKAGDSWTQEVLAPSRYGMRPEKMRFTVNQEWVAVPAGNFRAFRIYMVMTDLLDRRWSRRMWYAPEVRHWVKWDGYYGNGDFEYRLKEYHLAPAPSP